MRQLYRVLAVLVAVGVAVQVADIAMAWFLTLHDVDGGAVYAGEQDANIGHTLHGIVGFTVIPVLALLLLIVSFFAKVAGGVKWAGIVLLAVVVQVVLAIVSFSVPVLGALHGLNALVVAGVASVASRQAATNAPSGRSGNDPSPVQ